MKTAVIIGIVLAIWLLCVLFAVGLASAAGQDAPAPEPPQEETHVHI